MAFKIYIFMKKNTFLLLFSTIAFFYSDKINAQSQWVQQTSPTSSKLEALYFINSNIGFTSSSNVSHMYKTTDGGQTWASVGNYPARDISFVDANNGYASSAAGSPNGTMKKTTNGGTTWSAITPPNSSAYLGVFATSATTAYFINTEDKVIKSTNSGANLTSYTIPLTNPGSQNLTDIFFTDSNTGFICAQGGKIFKTTNAGATWSDLAVNNSTTLNMLFFVNASIGYAAGSGGKVLKTTDGGTTWVDKSTEPVSALNAIRFFDANNGLAVGLSGKIFKTTNGGDTWTAETSGTTAHLYNIFYLSASSAVIVGDNGTILKNTNLLSANEFTKNDDFNFFPNPITDSSILTVKNIDSYTNLTVDVYAINGQLLKSDTIKHDQYLLNKADYKAGVYILNLKEDNQIIKTLKFIVN